MSRRRVRFRPPPPRHRPNWCAVVAEQSVKAGSVQAVFDRLDQEVAAAVAAAQAHGRQVAAAVASAARLADDYAAFRAWQPSPSAEREPWPDEPGALPDPITCGDPRCGMPGPLEHGGCAALLRYVRSRRRAA
jgi:hypothetical protein